MPETVADRIRSTMAHVPDLSVRELEGLASLRRGVVQKILDGDTADPRGSTLVGVAGVLGATSDWLSAGVGDAPGERRVQRVVREARAASHPRKVAARRPARKRTGAAGRA